MKKLTVILLSVGFLMSMNSNNNEDLLNNETQKTAVYICNSDGATKYHYSKNCRGLSKCTHTISKVTIDEARKKGKKTLCGYED